MINILDLWLLWFYLLNLPFNVAASSPPHLNKVCQQLSAYEQVKLSENMSSFEQTHTHTQTQTKPLSFFIIHLLIFSLNFVLRVFFFPFFTYSNLSGSDLLCSIFYSMSNVEKPFIRLIKFCVLSSYDRISYQSICSFFVLFQNIRS